MSNSRKKIGSSTIAATSVISISMVLFMLGLLTLAVWFGKKKSDEVKENVEFTLLFKRNATTEEVQKVKSQLQHDASIKDIQYRSAEEVSKVYAEEVGKDFIEVIGYNPLGAELIIKLKSEFANDANMVALKSKLIKEPAIRDVVFTQAILDNINENVKRISLVAGAGLLIFFLVSLALINGTIRLQVFSQRFIIKSMQLVGATKWFITKPFVRSSVKYGVLGVVLSWLLIGGLLFAAYSYDPKLQKYYTLEEIAILAAALLVIGITFTCLSSFFVTRKYLKLNIEQLY